ncbi:MAG: hypothetical protein U0798_02260 [Gemmataceae bacterium]
MSAIVSLSTAAESAVETLLESGRPVLAVQLVRRLLSRPDAIGEVGSRLHLLAAECLVQLSRFCAARKHLLLAHRFDPANADVAFQLGERYERDDDGDAEKSAKWFLRAKKLDPRNPLYLASFGRAAIRIGQRKTGWACLVEAVEMCPGSAPILAIAVDACRKVDKLEVARRWVMIGRFLSTDRVAMDQVWERVRFDQASTTTHRSSVKSNRIAPFLRIVGKGEGEGEGEGNSRPAVRVDQAERTERGTESKPHFLRLMKMTSR